MKISSLLLKLVSSPAAGLFVGNDELLAARLLSASTGCGNDLRTTNKKAMNHDSSIVVSR